MFLNPNIFSYLNSNFSNLLDMRNLRETSYKSILLPKIRAVIWPGKNHKYFKKRKLNNEFQFFFLFNILLPEIHSDIKMLYNFVNNM